MTMDPSDNAQGGTSDDESDVDDQDIPIGMQFDGIIGLTPISAIGGLEVNSFAGSGPVIYPDFRTAIRDAWGEFESDYGLNGKPLTNEAISPEMREGRRDFKALLDRFEHESFSADIAQALRDLCYKYTPYRIVDISYVLPDGLEDLLETAYGRLEEGQDEEAMASAPPRHEFDLNDRKHLDWLANQLAFWADL